MPFEARLEKQSTSNAAVWAVAVAILLLAAVLAVAAVMFAAPRPVLADTETRGQVSSLRAEVAWLSGRLDALEKKVDRLTQPGGRGSNVGSERGALKDGS